jgi:protein-S-isoprenylcysteine O-methyltransferase Ste14
VSTPTHFAVAGVMIGWLITLIAMFMARRPSSTRIRQRNLAGLLGVSLQAMGFGLVFGWRRPALGSSGADWIIAASSASIAMASALFFLMAVRVLGRQWSIVPRILEDHVLIEKGPYSIVRHPIYASMLGMLVATGLALGWSPVILVAVLLYLVGTVMRIRLEEALLYQVFGQEYSLYSKRVPAFIPLLRGRKT